MSGRDEVLRNLVDMILAEDLAGAASRARPSSGEGDLRSAPSERTLRVPLPAGDELALRVRSGHPRAAWRLSRPPVLRLSPGTAARALEPHEVLAAVAELLPDAGCWPSLGAVIEDLLLAPARAEVSARAAPGCVAATTARPRALAVWERLASLRDRPFHPTARVRSGWNETDHDQFGPEAGLPLALPWVAVRRDSVRTGLGGPVPAHEEAGLLTPDEARLVKAALEDRGLDEGEHVALPAHPWQARHVLPAGFAKAVESGVCTPLGVHAGSFVATASVRTLSRTDGGAVHVKLPLGVASLGALRLLPPRYLHNANEGQRLLAAVAARHPQLHGTLRWCDERDWWVFDRPGVAEEIAGQLGCLLRRYPPELADDPRCSLVPLAALGVVTPDGQAPAVSYLSRALGLPGLDVLEAVARLLGVVALSCFALGVMPEVHGQNVVLVLRHASLAGVVLRDHDTVRLHLPWLRRAGVIPPQYVVAPGTPNTLVNDTPEALLGWFQTLGIQLALAAAVEATATHSGHEASQGWEAVAAGLADALGALELPPEAHGVARRQLFAAPSWPAKLVLTPLLERPGAGGASMPSGRGQSPNPLLGAGSRAQGAAR